MPPTRSAKSESGGGVQGPRELQNLISELAGAPGAVAGVEDAPQGRAPPGLEANWRADERPTGTRSRELAEWEHCLREREADLRLREQAADARRAELNKTTAKSRSAAGADERLLTLSPEPRPGSDLSRRFLLMSQLLSELRKSQIVALDEARGASTGACAREPVATEIDVEAVRQALEALHDGLETERQRLALEAERARAGKGSFELDKQHLDELMEALRHEQELQEQRLQQRKAAEAANGPCAAIDTAEGLLRSLHEQETAVMPGGQATDSSPVTEPMGVAAVEIGGCETVCPIDAPDEAPTATADPSREQIRAEMESMRVVAKDSARRAIRRHSWRQRLSLYKVSLALCCASIVLMFWAWGLAPGRASVLAWGAGAVCLIASLSLGFDLRRQARLRKAMSRRV